ncbi:MAG: hypothetical protein ACXWW8_02090 [Solirubrobacterales bacterium]
MPRFRALLLLPVSLVVALTIAACGGDSGGDEDPQQVLDATFSNDESVSSGNLEISVNVDAEGGDDPGSFEASLSGPFQGGEDGGVPQFDLTAEAKVDSSAQEFSGSADLTSTGDTAFVNFQGTDYELPQEVFNEFATAFAQAQEQTDASQQEDQNLLSSIGIDPSNWLTDLSNDGTEDVDGTETIHISGQADVRVLVADLKKIIAQVPQAAEQVTRDQLSQFDQVADRIESADFDIYTGADDDVLRKLDASVQIDPPDTEGAASSVEVGFSVSFSDVNEPQAISAPADAQPLSTLLEQFGVDPSQLGSAGAASGDGASAGGSSSASQAYLECLGEAQGQGAIDQCAALLQQ